MIVFIVEDLFALSGSMIEYLQWESVTKSSCSYPLGKGVISFSTKSRYTSRMVITNDVRTIKLTTYIVFSFESSVFSFLVDMSIPASLSELFLCTYL